MAIAGIWANRLIAGDKTWTDVPAIRQDAVKEELRRRVEAGELSADRYEEITGEPFEGEADE